MTREEAIEVLKDIYNYTRFDTYTTNEARTMAIKALEQEPNIDMESEEIKNLQKRAYLEGFHEASKMLVKQESKTGHWIDDKCSVFRMWKRN